VNDRTDILGEKECEEETDECRGKTERQEEERENPKGSKSRRVRVV